jgi:tetratricopeptide (TPR) repeat protein
MPSRRFLIPFVLTISFASILPAQDPSIDKLLNKLPPPEKFKRPPLERALEQRDLALNDPLVNEIVAVAERGSYKRAMELSSKLMVRYPRSPGPYCLMGMAAFWARQYGEAVSNFRRALVERPHYTFAFFGLAAVELEQKHFGAAIPPLQHFVEMEPDSTDGWLTLSDCALQIGRKQDAANYARRATVVSPSSPITWLHLARAERALGHAQQTIAAVAQAANLTRDNGEMLAIVGFSYINWNRIADAVSPLDRAAQTKPRDYLIQSQLGFCLVQVGRVNEGITHLQTGARLKPTYGPVWEHLGLAYQKVGRHDEAIKAFEKAAQLMPRSSLPQQHLSEEYRTRGQSVRR